MTDKVQSRIKGWTPEAGGDGVVCVSDGGNRRGLVDPQCAESSVGGIGENCHRYSSGSDGSHAGGTRIHVRLARMLAPLN